MAALEGSVHDSVAVLVPVVADRLAGAAGRMSESCSTVTPVRPLSAATSASVSCVSPRRSMSFSAPAVQVPELLVQSASVVWPATLQEPVTSGVSVLTTLVVQVPEASVQAVRVAWPPVLHVPASSGLSER